MFARKTFYIARACIVAVCLLGAVAPATAKSPPDWEKELAKGNKELSLNNKEKAVEIFTKKVEKYPSSGACHTALGKALKRLGKLDRAKDEFKKATQVEPSFADGFYEYGCSLENDKQYGEAAEAFTQYLSLAPSASDRKTIEDRIRFCKDNM